MTRLQLRDDLLDAQLLRTVSCAAYGGAELGECLAVAQRVREGDLGSWWEAWRAAGGDAVELAQREEQAGNRESARLAYLRACTYHRTAAVMLLGAPLDQRLIAASAAQRDAFRRAARLMEVPPEVVELPFEDGTLPGYFMRPAADGAARATVILCGGYDGTAEELYFSNGAAALARGYNVLAFDGPGQGSALLERGLTMRPDWENVITPVLDWVLARHDVDGTRVALIGLSLGGHLAQRAASVEHRLAACIADCGPFDLHAAALRRMPPKLAGGLREDRPWARLSARALLRALARKPTAGWALRRGMLVHGVDSPLRYLDALREFTLAGHAEQITCPTWVCDAEGDEIGSCAPILVEALRCEKVYVHFKAAEGAGDHCEQAARALYHARSFGWLDGLMAPRRVP